MIDFSLYTFHPVIQLPADYEVYDFSRNYDPHRPLQSPYGIGKYNEQREGMYTTELFTGKNPRNIHVGIDIAGPVGTPVHAFWEGEIFLAGYNPAEGDYGATLITCHSLGHEKIYALFGHLSHKSLEGKIPGKKIAKGEIIAWLGDRHENGGWNPHLHFQLSYERPEICDMPGVVSPDQLAAALQKYPDPRLVLGPLY